MAPRTILLLLTIIDLVAMGLAARWALPRSKDGRLSPRTPHVIIGLGIGTFVFIGLVAGGATVVVALVIAGPPTILAYVGSSLMARASAADDGPERPRR